MDKKEELASLVKEGIEIIHELLYGPRDNESGDTPNTGDWWREWERRSKDWLNRAREFES